MVNWTPDERHAQIRWTDDSEWKGKLGLEIVSVSTIARFASLASVEVESITVSGLPAEAYELLQAIADARIASDFARRRERDSLHRACTTLRARDMALSDIACIVGLSRQRVHQILKEEEEKNES